MEFIKINEKSFSSMECGSLVMGHHGIQSIYPSTKFLSISVNFEKTQASWFGLEVGSFLLLLLSIEIVFGATHLMPNGYDSISI
jgi:hypothetical protein